MSLLAVVAAPALVQANYPPAALVQVQTSGVGGDPVQVQAPVQVQVQANYPPAGPRMRVETVKVWVKNIGGGHPVLAPGRAVQANHAPAVPVQAVQAPVQGNHPPAAAETAAVEARRNQICQIHMWWWWWVLTHSKSRSNTGFEVNM